MADKDESDRAEAIISRIRGNPELQEKMREDPIPTLRDVGMNDAEIAELLGGEELQAMGTAGAELEPGEERPDPLLTSDSRFGQHFVRMMMRACSTSDEEETGTSCG